MKYTTLSDDDMDVVQKFAFGGIANPAQRATLRSSDREYLAQRQKELDAFEEQRQSYNTGLSKYQEEVFKPYQAQAQAYNTAAQQYNTDVYEPYQQQYGAYEKAINEYNAGDRTTDYAGPAEPTLARAFEMQAPTAPGEFSMAAPVLPFKEEEVVARQQQAAQTARKDAGNRATALNVVSNPEQFGFGSMSVSNRFMAEGGPVDKDTGPSARDMLDGMSGSDDGKMDRVVRELSAKGKMSEEDIMDAVTRVSNAGRGGDELLAYLSPESMAFLKSRGGSGSVNPETGLPEFFLKRLVKAVQKAFGGGRSEAAPAPQAPPPPPTAAEQLAQFQSRVDGLQSQLKETPETIRVRRGFRKRTVGNPAFADLTNQLTTARGQLDEFMKTYKPEPASAASVRGGDADYYGDPDTSPAPAPKQPSAADLLAQLPSRRAALQQRIGEKRAAVQQRIGEKRAALQQRLADRRVARDQKRSELLIEREARQEALRLRSLNRRKGSTSAQDLASLPGAIASPQEPALVGPVQQPIPPASNPEDLFNPPPPAFVGPVQQEPVQQEPVQQEPVQQEPVQQEPVAPPPPPPPVVRDQQAISGPAGSAAPEVTVGPNAAALLQGINAANPIAPVNLGRPIFSMPTPGTGGLPPATRAPVQAGGGLDTSYQAPAMSQPNLIDYSFLGGGPAQQNLSMPMFTEYQRNQAAQASSPSNFFSMGQPNTLGSAPGTTGIGSQSMPMFGAFNTMNAIDANPNLSPGMLGGMQNAGVMTDRMGNRIYSPGMVPGFAEGGEVEAEDDRPINTDPLGSAQQYMAQLTDANKPSPTRQSVKRLAKNTGGASSPKEMGMSTESLASAKDLVPKLSGKGSSREQMEEFVRTYQLKINAAKDKARGLGASTFGAPTLEGTSLTKNTLAKKRFAEGGEAKKPKGAESPVSEGLPAPGLTNATLWADTVSRGMYPKEKDYVKRDAARHLLASAVMADKVGPGVAQFLGKAYEFKEAPFKTTGYMLGLSEPRADYRTDVHNNALGVEMRDKVRDPRLLEEAVRNAIQAGSAKIEPGRAALLLDDLDNMGYGPVQPGVAASQERIRRKEGEAPVTESKNKPRR